MSFRARYRVRVQWGDCDAARRMFYPNYFRLFDSATHNLFEQAGLPLPALFAERGLSGLPIVDAQASFKASCGWGDWIEVESHVAAWRRTSFTVRHQLWRGEILAVEGHEIRVWATPHPDDPARIRAAAIPADIRARLAARPGT